MINKIIESISIALNTEFGDNYKIYPEKVEQGILKPCFFISCINPTNNQFLGRRYFRTNLFCIQYFPSTSSEKEEINDVLERLYWCLEYITAREDNKPIRGTNMHGETVEGVLNFFVNYNAFVYRVEDETLMKTLTIDMAVKG